MQISIVKRQLNHSYSMTMAEALEWEGVAQTAFGTSDDAREAMLAFLEKREPRPKRSDTRRCASAMVERWSR